MHTLVPAAVTASFSDGVAAIIFITAIYGILNLIGVSDRKSFLRLLFIGLTLGVLFVSTRVLVVIGQGLRAILDKLFVDVLHLPELTSDVVLFLILLALVLFFWTRHQDAKKKGNNGWMYWTLGGLIAMNTVSFVAYATILLTHYAASGLSWVQNFN